MIGRGAIRNPWLFEQIRRHQAGQSVFYPTGRDVLRYIEALWESQTSPDSPEQGQVQRLKKFMNFLGEGVQLADKFLFEMRRAQTRADFFRVCADYLDHDGPMRLEPHEVVTAPEDAPAALVP